MNVSDNGLILGKSGGGMGFKNKKNLLEQHENLWIPISFKLPEEKEDPTTTDWVTYPCVFDNGEDIRTVRYYKFGDGHWWNGAQIMDSYVTHWMNIYEQQIPEPVGQNMTINFSDQPINIDKTRKSIFLAGPTLRDSSFDKSWRKAACNILRQLNFDGIVYVPEFGESENPMDFLNQVDWERDGLVNADVIVFHIPRKLPELPGFTTNVEFGMYLAKRPHAVILCAPENSEKNRYLEWLYKKEKATDDICRTLNEVLEKAVQMTKINVDDLL